MLEIPVFWGAHRRHGASMNECLHLHIIEGRGNYFPYWKYSSLQYSENDPFVSLNTEWR